MTPKIPIPFILIMVVAMVLAWLTFWEPGESGCHTWGGATCSFPEDNTLADCLKSEGCQILTSQIEIKRIATSLILQEKCEAKGGRYGYTLPEYTGEQSWTDADGTTHSIIPTESCYVGKNRFLPSGLFWSRELQGSKTETF